MKTEDLKPGMYEITQDIKNPKADRRKSDRDFSALPMWRKGLRVCVEIEVSENKLHPNRATIFRAGDYSFHGVTGRENGEHNHPGFDALVAALQPVEWTEHEWVEAHVNNGKWVLEELLKAGKVTKGDISLILNDWTDDDGL